MEYTVVRVKDTDLTWKDSYDYPVSYYIPGYLRGFNVEYKDINTGELKYGSCVFTYDDISEEMSEELEENINFVTYIRNNLKPTGRLIFRGYYDEDYDMYEREYFVRPVDPKDFWRW